MTDEEGDAITIILLSASEEGVPGSKQGRDIRWSERQSYRGRTRRGRKGGSP